MVLDASLLNNQYYKVLEQSREWSSALHGVVAIEKVTFGSPSTTVANFT